MRNDWDVTILPDVLALSLDIVFCGTAAGNVSSQRGAYYAGPGNMFWPTLHAVGLTRRLLQPEEYRAILSFGLGLTDLAKAVSGVDAQLNSHDFDRDRLAATILRYQRKIVGFTTNLVANWSVSGRRSTSAPAPLAARPQVNEPDRPRQAQAVT